MMDRKPWQDKGLRRSFDGDEAENAAALAVSTASTVKNVPIAASSVIARAVTSVTVSLLATVRV